MPLPFPHLSALAATSLVLLALALLTLIAYPALGITIWNQQLKFAHKSVQSDTIILKAMYALPAIQAVSPAQTVDLRIVFPVHPLNISNLPPRNV